MLINALSYPKIRRGIRFYKISYSHLRVHIH